MKNSKNQPYAIVSMVWSPTEQRYPLVEKELCLLLRCYKSMKKVGDLQEVTVLTDQPIVKELSKGTVEGTKAYLSRWGKWQMLLSDPTWVFEAKYKKPKDKPETQSEQDFVPTITLYTDGSKKTKEDYAVWGYLAIGHDGRRLNQTTGKVKGPKASAQLAEVTAVMMALAYADKRKHKAIKIVTDSQYVAGGITENLRYWKETKYQSYKGKDLEHQTEWIKIAELMQKKMVKVVHVRSHTVSPWMS